MACNSLTPVAIKSSAPARLEDSREIVIALNHSLHADPEVAFEEHRAAARVSALLTDAGFAVQIDAYGLPSAVEVVYGSGEVTVTVCAEYDALPEIGHACGHNVIASAAVATAIGLAAITADLGIRVKLLGTPAEEHDGGKVLMLAAGAWEDCTFSLMIHRGGGEDRPVASIVTRACDRFRATYTGGLPMRPLRRRTGSGR